MKRHYGPEIVIAITIILALANFFLYNHSGIAITDVTLEEYNNTNDTYNLTYYLRVGRTFNVLDCEYTFYDNEGHIIHNDSSILEKVYSGSHTINKNISTTDNSSLNNTRNINILIYDKRYNSQDNNTNKTPQPLYNKTVNITN